MRRVLAIDNPWTIGLPGGIARERLGFRMVRLPLDSRAAGGAAPIGICRTTGTIRVPTPAFGRARHWAWGVPYYVEDPQAKRTSAGLRPPVTFVFPKRTPAGPTFSSRRDPRKGPWPSRPARSEQRPCIAPTARSPGQSWPPCFQQKIFMAEVPVAEAADHPVTPRDAYLMAVTVLMDAGRQRHLRRGAGPRPRRIPHGAGPREDAGGADGGRGRSCPPAGSASCR